MDVSADHAAARSIAEPILTALCAKGNFPVPRLNVVDALASGDANTAKVSSVRGAGVIELPHALTKKHSADELESLLGHELGHIRLKHSLGVGSRRVAYWSGLALIAAFIPIFVIGALKNTSIWLILIEIAAVLTLSALCFCACFALSRKNESACDVFSYELTGNLGGALQLLNTYLKDESPDKDPNRRNSLTEEHPTPQRRIAALVEAVRAESPSNTYRVS